MFLHQKEKHPPAFSFFPSHFNLFLKRCAAQQETLSSEMKGKKTCTLIDSFQIQL